MKFRPERLTRAFDSPEKKSEEAISSFQAAFSDQLIATSEDSQLTPVHQEAANEALFLGVRAGLIETEVQGFCQRAVYRPQEVTPLPLDSESTSEWSMAVMGVWDNNSDDPQIASALIHAMALPRYSTEAPSTHLLAVNFKTQEANYVIQRGGFETLENFTKDDRRMPEVINFWQSQIAGAEVVVQPPKQYGGIEQRSLGHQALSRMFRRRQ